MPFVACVAQMFTSKTGKNIYQYVNGQLQFSVNSLLKITKNGFMSTQLHVIAINLLRF